MVNRSLMSLKDNNPILVKETKQSGKQTDEIRKQNINNTNDYYNSLLCTDTGSRNKAQ